MTRIINKNWIFNCFISIPKGSLVRLPFCILIHVIFCRKIWPWFCSIKISNKKSQCNAENPWGNRMCKHAFSDNNGSIWLQFKTRYPIDDTTDCTSTLSTLVCVLTWNYFAVIGWNNVLGFYTLNSFNIMQMQTECHLILLLVTEHPCISPNVTELGIKMSLNIQRSNFNIIMKRRFESSGEQNWWFSQLIKPIKRWR